MQTAHTTISYPPRVALAQLPTPLVPLHRLSAEIGGPRLWIKRDDLTGTELSGNKVRKLEFSIAEALARQCDTLITCGGLQSNHCRATALAGARLGLAVHLVLRGLPQGPPEANLFLDHLAGAHFSFCTPEEFVVQREERFAPLVERYAAEGHRAFVIPAGASDEVGLWGYVVACEELKSDIAQAGFRPDAIVCATGSGGTQAGLIVGNALHELDTRILGINVDEDAQYFRTKIRADLERWRERYGARLAVESLAIEIIEGYLGPGYGRAERPVFDTIARVARTEGLVLDPVYTAKAFHGLISEIEKGRFAGAKHLIFVHTGGLFGLLAERSAFRFGRDAGR